MAETDSTPQTDRDLASMAEARALARRAKQAWLELAEFSQERIDAIVDATAAAATTQAEAFARLAVEETGYGVVDDKIQKNLFSSQKVYQFIRPMKTVGVIARHDDRRVVEIAEPFGVVAAVIPTTNPTSTAIYKILIALKARCTIVLSPHPAAVKCITRVAEVMEEAARRAGAPAGSINWMTAVSLEGTQELMKHRDAAVILATGGMGTAQRLPNPALVGKPAVFIAGKCGLTVPAGTRVLVAPLAGVGRDYPLSIEKLCPVLSYYVVKDWREGCERCKQILRYGGMGHTMSIHSRNDQIILEFGLHKPAYRIVVNSPTTHGSVGLSTGLDPAMTLGCGGFGGNITSDNISPRHLLNIKRLAHELTPIVSRWDRAASPHVQVDVEPRPGAGPTGQVRAYELPVAPARPPAPTGISPDALSRRIDEFLGSRGFKPGSAEDAQIQPNDVGRPFQGRQQTAPDQPPLDFVCEEDVRMAIQAGRKLVVSERAIVTPAARDLGEQHRVFAVAPWRG